MLSNKISKSKKRKIVTNFAKKSIIFKPLVFKRLYRLSFPSTKKKIEEAFNIYYKKSYNSDEKKYIKRDMIYCRTYYGVSFQEYFLYNFPEKRHMERKNFIANKERKKYLRLLGNLEGYNILSDKYLSYLFLKKFYDRDIIKLSSTDDLDIFLNYIKKHPVFVIKPLDSSFGKGIKLVNSDEYNDKKSLFMDLIGNGPLILEEHIKQNNKLASLHSNSLNTIRMITYLDNENNVTIHYPFIKIGQKGSFVDNGGAGGIIALIDSNTGKIITLGKDEKNNSYLKHPDTKIRIKDFVIPYWDDAIKFSKEIARAFPDTRYIGWDIALTDKNKWVIVEGNCRTQFFGQQITDEIGKKKDLEKLINYKKLKRKRKQFDKMWKDIKN